MHIRRKTALILITALITATIFYVPLEEIRATEQLVLIDENLSEDVQSDDIGSSNENNSLDEEPSINDDTEIDKESSINDQENTSIEEGDDSIDKNHENKDELQDTPNSMNLKLRLLFEKISPIPKTISTDGLEANEATAETFEDLRVLLESPLYSHIDTVYIANDIVRTGLPINSNRNNVTIIGHTKGDNQTRYKMTDLATSTSGLVALSTNEKITFKDVIIDSYNWYGPVASGGNTGVVIEYNNVIYSGPQLVYSPYGKIRIIDSSIIVLAKSGSNPLGEIAEINQVEIGGNTTIRKDGYTGEPGFEFFSSNSFMNILPDSNVVFEDNNTYYVASCFIANGAAVPLNIGANASLSVKSGSGLNIGSYTSSNINIGTDASLKVHQTTTSAAVITLAGTLDIKDGGSLEIINDGNNEALRFYGASALLKFDNPKRIKLYSSNSGRVVYGVGNMSGNVGAINSWNSSVNYTDAMSNTPNGIWNKNNGNNLDVSVSTYGASTTSANITNEDPSDVLDDNFTNATFDISKMQMIVMGDYDLDVDDIYENSPNITGSTRAGSSVKIEYNNNNIDKLINAAVAPDGSFDEIVPDSPIAMDTEVMTTTHQDYLKARHMTTVLEKIGILEFISVPSSMDFPKTTIPTSDTIVSRSASAWTMTLSDTRGSDNSWEVNASIDEPLTGSDSNGTHTLPNRLVYVDGSSKTPLSSTPMTIFAGTTTSNPIFDLSWNSNEGILLDLVAGDGVPHVSYSTTINWTLVDAP